jgi:hypothetical protein
LSVAACSASNLCRLRTAALSSAIAPFFAFVTAAGILLFARRCALMREAAATSE